MSSKTKNKVLKKANTNPAVVEEEEEEIPEVQSNIDGPEYTVDNPPAEPGSSDEENDKRGVAREGQLSDQEIKIGQTAKLDFGETPPPVSDNAMYIGSIPKPSERVENIIPKEAPDGWVRDTEENLWSIDVIRHLRVDYESLAHISNSHQYMVKGEIGQEMFAVFSKHRGEESGCKEAADAFRDKLAQKISFDKGYTFSSEDAVEEIEEIEETE